MKFLIAALLFVTSSVFGSDHDYPPAETPPPLILPASTTYGLLALASSGHQFDWGVPDKLQFSGSMAFTEGGNQAVSFALANRFGGVLVNAHFTTTIDAPDSQDDYAVVVSGTMRF